MHPRLQDRHPSSGMTHCSHTNAPHVPHSRTQWAHTPSPHPSHVCQHSSHAHMPHVRHWWSAPGNGSFPQSGFSHSNRMWRFATSRISNATSQRRESSFTFVPYVASNQSDNESGTSDSQRSIWTAISARPSAFFLKSFASMVSFFRGEAFDAEPMRPVHRRDSCWGFWYSSVWHPSARPRQPIPQACSRKCRAPT